MTSTAASMQTVIASNRLAAPLVTFAVALTVYALTLAPDLTWAHFGSDGGELITAAVTLGVPHPHGYPTYTLLGKLISLIPLGTVAYRFNLFSAICIAGAAAILADIGRKLTNAPIPAIAAALTFAFARLVWSQAIITEVYGLNLLLLALLLWAMLKRSHPFWIGLLWGLSLTTHLTSLIMGGLVVWAVMRHRQRHFAILGVLLGLLPFAAIPLFARGSSPVVWSDPTTLSGWWWLVSGRIYRPNVFSHPIWPRLTIEIGHALRQFAYIGWVALPVALFTAQQKLRPLIVFLMITAGLYTIYAFAYDTIDFAVFALPALLLTAPVLAVGLKRIQVWSLLLPLLAIGLNFGALSLHNDTSVRRAALDTLTALPQSSIVMTPGDQSIFSLWYYQNVENVRPDVILVDENLFAFDWYRARLAQRYSSLSALAADDLDAFQQANEVTRPICYLSIGSNAPALCFGNVE